MLQFYLHLLVIYTCRKDDDDKLWNGLAMLLAHEQEMGEIGSVVENVVEMNENL